MALPIYAFIKGKVQGNIKGGVTRAGTEGAIEVKAFDHSVQMPVDESTGKHRGRRVHHPVTILKEIDESTPLLFKAMVEHELLDIDLKFWKQEMSTGGQEVQYYTVHLEEATIVSMRERMPDQNVPMNREMPHMDELAFAYKAIRWTHEEAGIEAYDSHDKAAK